jgi:RNA polymerase sigma-70 factor (ECF subfamily)
MSTDDRLLIPGREQAARLFREHGRALRAFVGARVRDPLVADDICQEAFLAALVRGVPGDEAGRWLFAIARNKVLKHMRDRRETAVAEPGEAVAAHVVAAEAEEKERVRGAVSALEAELEEVIRLRYEGGLDYKEIADRLGLPVSTVQGRLKRARLALKAALEPKETA